MIDLKSFGDLSGMELGKFKPKASISTRGPDLFRRSAARLERRIGVTRPGLEKHPASEPGQGALCTGVKGPTAVQIQLIGGLDRDRPLLGVIPMHQGVRVKGIRFIVWPV